jgi:hypothetical protein
MSDITLQEALDQLNRYTADEVAELLMLAGKKGHQSLALSCPMANYLSDVLGSECSVGPWRAHNMLVDGDDRWADLPDGVSYFVDRFDRGHYPDLIEEILE